MGKKYLYIVFWQIRRLRVLRTLPSYSMSNKLLLVARHILTTGLKKMALKLAL